MIKKWFCSFLLIVFINYIWGCTVHSTEKALKESIEPTENITQVVKISGEVIDFDEYGGHYLNATNALIGSIDKAITIVPVEQVKEFRTKVFPAKNKDELINSKIIELITVNNKFIAFDDKGGKYSPDNYFYTGKDKDGKSVSYQSLGVQEAYIKAAETISLESLIQNPSTNIKQVLLKDGTIKTFSGNGGQYVSKTYEIGGVNSKGEFVKVNPDSILYANVSRVDYGLSILATVGVLVAAAGVGFLIVLATKQSCPFIYSYDGDKYVFDAEPLGGAVSKGLERIEVSKLENLKEIDGKYKLLVRNEVNETQYINSMKLIIADYSTKEEVVFDFEGKPYLIDKPVNLINAYDENGKNILNFVIKEDNILWQTKMPKDSSQIPNTTRHQLTFSFPKPKDAKQVNLIYNLGTSLWGSNMIREMLNLRGDQIQYWYDDINKKEAGYNQLMDFTQREETYQLKLYVKTNSGWRNCGLINGSGPLITEKRLSTINISDIEGDSLVFRINPPKGFWVFNYLGAQYGNLSAPLVSEINFSKAVDQNGKDISTYLTSSDNNYYTIPNVGDYFYLEYDTPKQTENTKRSIFVKTDGYYLLNLKKDLKAQPLKLFEIGATPGKIVKYSFERFVQWNSPNFEFASKTIK